MRTLSNIIYNAVQHGTDYDTMVLYSTGTVYWAAYPGGSVVIGGAKCINCTSQHGG